MEIQFKQAGRKDSDILQAKLRGHGTNAVFALVFVLFILGAVGCSQGGGGGGSQSVSAPPAPPPPPAPTRFRYSHVSRTQYTEISVETYLHDDRTLRGGRDQYNAGTTFRSFSPSRLIFEGTAVGLGRIDRAVPVRVVGDATVVVVINPNLEWPNQMVLTLDELSSQEIVVSDRDAGLAGLAQGSHRARMRFNLLKEGVPFARSDFQSCG